MKRLLEQLFAFEMLTIDANKTNIAIVATFPFAVPMMRQGHVEHAKCRDPSMH